MYNYAKYVSDKRFFYIPPPQLKILFSDKIKKRYKWRGGVFEVKSKINLSEILVDGYRG